MLSSLLSQEEGKTLEFKEAGSALHRILKTIVAFANTAGGTLIIGIRDKTKEVVGVPNILNEEERISSAIADSIAPLLVPSFQFHTWRNRDILIITVSCQPTPYFIKSEGMGHGVYVRLGSTNRVADKNTISEIRRHAQHESYDELPNIKANVDDIDLVLASKMFSDVSKKFDRNKAKSLGLIVEHHAKQYPSNGGILLFGKNHNKFFPDAIIRCGRFAGTTKTTFIDQLDVKEILPLAVDPILSFVERHTSTKSEIGRKQRIDTPEYPPQVVREAVINALIHADYTVRGANIQLAIFSDRIEITNPGALPYGLSLKKALSGISQLRNRVIGSVFKELGLIEQWGSGLTRMIDICREQNISEPKFEEQDHFFRVTLFHDMQEPIITEEWQKMIIKYLQTEKEIKTSTASELLGVSKRTASARLTKMYQLGIISEISTGPFDPKKKFVLQRKLRL